MTVDLGWYERMSQRAKMRAAIKRDGRLTGAEEWTVIEVRDERESRHRPEYLAGPPGGCHDCYRWWRTPLGQWGWWHGAAIDPEARPCPLWDDVVEPDVEHCTHACHGPAGKPLPVVAIG